MNHRFPNLTGSKACNSLSEKVNSTAQPLGVKYFPTNSNVFLSRKSRGSKLPLINLVALFEVCCLRQREGCGCLGQTAQALRTTGLGICSNAQSPSWAHFAPCQSSEAQGLTNLRESLGSSRTGSHSSVSPQAPERLGWGLRVMGVGHREVNIPIGRLKRDFT